MIATADEASYFAPAKNYFSTGIWADNSQGISRYFQRPPGYGLIYGCMLLLFGSSALAGLKIFQILLFFLSIQLLGKCINHFTKSRKLALVASLFYALMPMYSGFMYYTLTEAVSPFLVIWLIYSYQLNSKSGLIQLLLATVAILLVRPQLLIFPLALFLLSALKKEKKRGIVLLVGCIPFTIWMIRAATISGEFQGLHPIYSDTNVSLYRPPHAEMTNLFRIWESDGERFHTTIAAIKSAKDSAEMKRVVRTIPREFQKECEPLFFQFHQLLNDPEYARSKEFKRKENKFISEVQRTRENLISKNRIQYIVITPVKSAKYLLSKSQLNLYLFQAELRGNLLIEGLRILSVLTINLGFFFAFLLLFRHKSLLELFMAASLILYLFYLAYFQRLNEERYLTPLLPVLLMVTALGIHNIGILKKFK